ncbi:MAG: NUDIX domain-containing protein [Gammaproteobacteria bacterium]|nr:NUDIX domain-containing protein [Gammaproteobacteria bacterium]
MKQTDYRKNVGIMLIDNDEKILAGEARYYPGEWMMPQGGAEGSESPEETLWRELLEETGITRDQTTLVAQYPHWLYYKLRRPLTENNHTFLGQKQRWFLLHYNGPLPNLEEIAEKEFLQFDWVTSKWLLAHSAEVKVDIYSRLFSYFL